MIILLAWLSFGIAFASEIEISTTYSPSEETLTTERIWAVDPGEKNPHRQRWALKREVKIEGLEAVQLGSRNRGSSAQPQFGIQVKGLISKAEGLIREAGPWYIDPTMIPCADDAQKRFGTEGGARVAVDTAGRLWGQVLKEEKAKLASQLAQIKTAKPHWSLNRAVQVYSEWLRSVEAIWRARAYPAARAEEWKSYQRLGLLGRCQKKPELRSWREMMEAVPAVTPDTLIKPRLRAPARRWDGAFSVRADAVISDVKLTGQMIIDSGAPKSLASPEWLTGQGFPPDLVQVPGVPPEKFSFTAAQGGAGAGRRIQIDSLRVSGDTFQFTDLLLAELDLFAPPQETAFCCDAILGADFLARQVVELTPGAPGAEARPARAGPAHFVRIWNREGFVPPPTSIPDPVWIEAYFRDDGIPVSDCNVGQIQWLSGSKVAWQGKYPEGGSASSSKGLTLSCGGLEIVRGLLRTDGVQKGTAQLGIGMPVLGRGPVIFDLPHGRIWFSRSALDKPIPRDRSGLKTTFKQAGDERVLVVTAIQPGTPAAKLAAKPPRNSALGVGTRIFALDGLPVERMDQWAVSQILAGVRSSSVKVEWGKAVGKTRWDILEGLSPALTQ